jgi:hypothetical protein
VGKKLGPIAALGVSLSINVHHPWSMTATNHGRQVSESQKADANPSVKESNLGLKAFDFGPYVLWPTKSRHPAQSFSLSYLLRQLG